MKKLGKLLTSLVVIGGAAAGAYAVYKKFFAPEDLEDDFDEDFEDEFEDEEDEEEASKREYVSLNPTAASDEKEDGVSAEAIAEKEAAMAEDETAKAEKAKEEAEE